MDAHRIAKKLWIGSKPGPDVCQRGFDAVVLCAFEYQDLPLPGCRILYAPLLDEKPSGQDIRTAVSAAKKVHKLRAAGKRVLVTCAMGINRSSLVAAIALMLSGTSATRAIAQIRARRRPQYDITPLSNRHFVAALHALERGR